MVTPTGQAPHIPFHLGPTQASTQTPTPTPTNGMAGAGGAGSYVQPPPGLGHPPGLPQPTSNMSAAQQLKDRLAKGTLILYDGHSMLKRGYQNVHCQ